MSSRSYILQIMLWHHLNLNSLSIVRGLSFNASLSCDDRIVAFLWTSR